MLYKVFRNCAGFCLGVVGVAGVPGDLQTWWNMLTLLDSWGVRVVIALIGIALITYPQWERVLRVRLELHDDHSLWYGIRWRYHWWRIERQERKKDNS